MGHQVESFLIYEQNPVLFFETWDLNRFGYVIFFKVTLWDFIIDIDHKRLNHSEVILFGGDRARTLAIFRLSLTNFFIFILI